MVDVDEGLSRSGWSVGVTIGDYIMPLDAGRPSLRVGSAIPYKRVLL